MKGGGFETLESEFLGAARDLGARRYEAEETGIPLKDFEDLDSLEAAFDRAYTLLIESEGVARRILEGKE